MAKQDAPTFTQTFLPSEGIASAFELAVLEGPDEGRAHRIEPAEGGRTLVGKGPVCDVQLADPAVSRRHASLEIAGHRLRITDLQSTNGTFVDGVAVVEAYLVGGELVRVGSTAMRFERVAPHAPAPPMRASFGRVIGASLEMRRIYPLCERLAKAHVPLVIEGETGTGKEALAESLHESGPRASGPYVVFDCTAVPGNLLEAELFGHERGAFTGAVAARRGVFEQAHGGTLLIDEIGDLELPFQAKLLRAIERGEVRRLGSEKPIKVDVRVLSATRRDLDREVQEGRFRDDLFHRLAVTRVELPPLRRRRGDVPLLAMHFWEELGGDPRALGSSVVAKWNDSPWPGNVRELRNAVARHLAVGEEGDEAAPLDDPAVGGGAPLDGDTMAEVLALDLPLTRARERVVEEFERRYVERAVVKHGGSIQNAAAAAGVALRHFQRVRAKYKPG